MIAVTFRFYAQLNDFLPSSRRGRRFTVSLVASASIKDTIEALGVPHPEVDLILVNGAGVDFTYRVAGGDDIAVFPSFHALDVSSLRRVGIDTPAPVRFVLDVHLGKLASLLRLAGFDAVVVADDAAAAETAARDDRVLLTRDVGLLKRAVVTSGRWVRHTNPERQFAEILERYELVERVAPFTRCLECNGVLQRVSVEAVSDRLLPRTRQAFGDFQECPGCGRVYWRGSHYRRLVDVLARARARAAGGAVDRITPAPAAPDV